VATVPAPAAVSAVLAAGAAAEPVSLLGVVAWPLLKRALPVVGGLVLALLIWLAVRAAQN
jgi:hypothetical protein